MERIKCISSFFIGLLLLGNVAFAQTINCFGEEVDACTCESTCCAASSQKLLEQADLCCLKVSQDSLDAVVTVENGSQSIPMPVSFSSFQYTKCSAEANRKKYSVAESYSYTYPITRSQIQCFLI